jgi:hypothetical protein
MEARSRSLAGPGLGAPFGLRTGLADVFELGMIDIQTGEGVYLSAVPYVIDLSWSAEGFILASMAEAASPSPPVRGVTTYPTRDPWPGVE